MAVNQTPTQELRNQTLSTLQKILPPGPTRALNTSQLAQVLGVQPGTIRRGLCVDGHYMGLIPEKFANGRLLWPIA